MADHHGRLINQSAIGLQLRPRRRLRGRRRLINQSAIGLQLMTVAGMALYTAFNQSIRNRVTLQVNRPESYDEINFCHSALVPLK